MLWRKAKIGWGVSCVALAAAFAAAPARAMADDARLVVTPAVLQSDDSGSGVSGANIELVRHRGYWRGGRGWGGGYRGFRGYGYGGFYRPIYPRRVYPGFYAGPGYGYGYPGYGYGYGGGMW